MGNDDAVRAEVEGTEDQGFVELRDPDRSAHSPQVAGAADVGNLAPAEGAVLEVHEHRVESHGTEEVAHVGRIESERDDPDLARRETMAEGVGSIVGHGTSRFGGRTTTACP